MTIRKGEPWGEPAVCPPDVTVVAGDRELRDFVVAARQLDVPVPPVGVAAGDLARTCGGGISARPESARVTVDAMNIVLDGRRTWGVAHVAAHRGWWRGEVLLAMNAEYRGIYDVVPRSHPNDGKVDVLRVDPAMTVRQRWQARKRALTGAHLPHRHLRVESVPAYAAQFRQPMIVWIDGVRWGAVSSLSIEVESDALTLYV